MYLLIDNYDSFTYNLYQAFAAAGIEVLVKRNDELTVKMLDDMSPEKIIISPGPGTPSEAGISTAAIRCAERSIPVLGICLGHQCIVSFFGGAVKRISDIVHGKTSPVHHNGEGIFEGIASPFDGARYHSLETVNIPGCLEITAWTEKGTVMGIRHKDLPITGLQFHPESFMTNTGDILLKNFIEGKK